MKIFTILTGIIFAILSATILSYVSLTTMIGPWIAPTLVLFASMFYKLFAATQAESEARENIILAQAIGAGAGIIATGISFTLPILYFLDTTTFNNWLAQPSFFCIFISISCLSAGTYGIFLGRIFSVWLIKNPELSFPVSKLTYKALVTTKKTAPISQLCTGIGGTLIISILREGICGYSGYIPKTLYLFSPFFGKILAFPVWPTLWAIGYTSGITITLPLLVGLLSKYMVIAPLNYHSSYFQYTFFKPLDDITFVTAFCAGIVLCEFLVGFCKHPKIIIDKILGYVNEFKKNIQRTSLWQVNSNDLSKSDGIYTQRLSKILETLEPLLALGSTLALLTYLQFSFIAQITLLILVAFATYEICFIASKIGLLQFGRFSAFVLIPMIMIFKLTFIQMTAVCVFFNICAAVASDTIFDRKTGSYCNLSWSRIHLAQWIGLIATSLCIGFILYLLFTSLTLGSEALFAQRGRIKALLIQSFNLDSIVVTLGFFYGLILKRLKINPTMTLGGIIMPNNVTLGLVAGGFVSSLFKDKDSYLPLCSGILATESIWIIALLLVRFFS